MPDLAVSFCVTYLQIFEDSIVLKSVFESARQRIVTNEEGVVEGTAIRVDNGGGDADQFVSSAGERQIISICKKENRFTSSKDINGTPLPFW